MINLLFSITVAHFVVANIISLVLLAAALRAVRRRWQLRLRRDAPDFRQSPLMIPISAIVPAFNEEDSVIDAVLALIDSKMPELEIIVVDDGSTDETAQRLTDRFDMIAVESSYPQQLATRRVNQLLHSRLNPNVWLIRKDNGGKADAVNAAVNLARFRYVLVTDADSVFEPGAVHEAMAMIGFSAKTQVGVGGMVRVRNGMAVEEGRLIGSKLPRSLLGQFQVVEYMGAMTGSRAGWNLLNGVPVLSGAFSIWRRDVVLELGGMTRDTTHEDIEFTFRVHEHFRRRREPYLISTLPDSVVWTEAPHRWRDLYQQRKRWQRVVLECVWRYRRMIANPKYGEVGTITMPYMLVFEALGPLVELAALALAIVLFLQGALAPLVFAFFLIAATALVALTRIAAIALDSALYHRFTPAAVLRLSLVALLELFLYRPVILMARLMAIPEFLMGRKTWERAHRQPVASHA
jgi:cellulose synthase/poly-beta-1,6-N-acetylglucosamine synthase-like glycosyltransferase